MEHSTSEASQTGFVAPALGLWDGNLTGCRSGMWKFRALVLWLGDVGLEPNCWSKPSSSTLGVSVNQDSFDSDSFN